MPSNPTSPSDLIRVEARALEALAERLDGLHALPTSPVPPTSSSPQPIRGKRVILTGIGKSGLIARKIAATLTSTGTPAHFLHPAEALHGDIGAVCPGDIRHRPLRQRRDRRAPPPSSRSSSVSK